MGLPQPTESEVIMSEPTPPRTNLERQLVLIWENVLERTPIGIQEDFFDLGGTSVQAVRVFAEIEQIVHQRHPLSLILGAPTIEKLAASLLPAKAQDRKAYVVPVQSGGEKPFLFCVSGGIEWRTISEYLGPDQPIFSIELESGVAEQTRGPNIMEKLARHMVSALCAKQTQGPYYLSGYCRGGIFAYEVARQLELYGHQVGLLAMIESRNPSPHFRVRTMNSVRRNAIRAAYQVDQLYRLITTGGIPEYVRLRRWQLRRFMQRVLSRVSPGFQLRARQSGRMNPEEFLNLKANLFKPKALACSTAIFRCSEWQILSAGDPYLGWRQALTGHIETHEIPGDHEAMLREPNIRVLAEKLKACLENARQQETQDFDVIMETDQKLYLRHSRA